MASSPTRQHIPVDRLLRTCTSQKVTYETREQALDGAERGMEQAAVSPGCHLTPYLCWDCGHWHLWNRPIVHVPPNPVY